MQLTPESVQTPSSVLTVPLPRRARPLRKPAPTPRTKGGPQVQAQCPSPSVVARRQFVDAHGIRAQPSRLSAQAVNRTLNIERTPAMSRVRGAAAAAPRLLAGVCLVLLAACSRPTPESLMRSAEQHLAQRQDSAALIELRNAVRLAPTSGKAHGLLGTALVRTGRPDAAEGVLRKALELGESPDAVLPSLAEAMSLQGRHEALLSEFGSRHLQTPAAEAAWQASLGSSWLARGDAARAAQAFELSLAGAPENAPARLGQARIAARGGSSDKASAIVDEVLAAEPGNSQAYLLRAQLLLAQGQRAPAKEAAQRAVAADAGHLAARIALATLQIEDREFEQAKAVLDAAGPAAAIDLRLVFLRSLLALRTNDLQAARDHIAKVLQRLPDHVPALNLAGEIELRSNNLSAAEQNFKRAMSFGPASPATRRALAATYLRQGQSGRALELLQPLLQEDPADAIVAKLAAEAYLARGDTDRAAALYEALGTGGSGGSVAHLRLGQIALGRGDLQRAADEMRAAAAMDTKDSAADQALVALYLRQRDPQRALAAAEALRKQQPREPMAYVLAGLAHLAGKNPSEARRSFDTALEIRPGHLGALRGLAEVALAEGHPEQALQRYETMLADKPNDDQLLVALAELQQRMGRQAAATETLRRAIAANRSTLAAYEALIRLHLRGRDPAAAMAVAREAVNANLQQPRPLELLGDTQEATGATEDAARTYQALTALEPQALRPLLKRASVLEKRLEFREAAKTMRRALRIAPDNEAIVRKLVAYHLAAGDSADAMAQAKEWQARIPRSALGHTLEGDIYATGQRWREAERAYRQALTVEPAASEPAVQLARALFASGRSKEALAYGADWLVRNPGDPAMHIVIAEAAMQARDYKTASTHFEAVLKAQPDNVLVLSSLAAALGKLHDPRAAALDARAAALAQNSPEVLDQMALLHLKRGDPKLAMAHLERVRSLAPDRPDLRLHYAMGLLQVGRIDEGKAELRDLAALPEPFAGKAEIAGLLGERAATGQAPLHEVGERPGRAGSAAER